MLNENVLDVWYRLSNITPVKGVKLNYAIAKNIALLNSEAEAIKKALEPNAEFQTYNKERIELCEEHAKKDENGKTIKTPLANGTEEYVFGENQAKFDKAVKALQEVYKDGITAQEEKLKKDTLFLKEPNKVELHKIDMTEIPEDIDTNQMRALYPLIKEN